MIVHKLALVLLTASLVAVTTGCGADATSEAPTGSGSSKGTGKGKSSSDSTDGTTPADDGSDQDARSGTDTPKQTPKKSNGAQCEESADCQSDFCVFSGNGLGMCTTTCDDNIDCELSWSCVRLSNAPQKVCVPE